MTSLDISSNLLTRGKWTNVLGDDDRSDDRNYETDMTGVIALADVIPDMGAISKLIFNGPGLLYYGTIKSLPGTLIRHLLPLETQHISINL